MKVHEGALIELRGDEALAVFSSARLAIRAAIELQRCFVGESERNPTLPLRVGIGLDAGEAVPVNGGYRGMALNLAARLCALAGPGEILSSEALSHLAGPIDGVAYQPRGAAQLKGFDVPVKVFAVTSSSAGASPPVLTASAEGTGDPQIHRLPVGDFLGALPSGPFVARSAEVDQLLALIDPVLRGQGQMVLLSGEPGAGKTRVAQEITLRLRNQGFLIAAGRCYEAEASSPYYPFLDALAAIFAQVPARLQLEAAHRWPYLGALLPNEPWAQRSAGSSGEGADEQSRVVRTVADFITIVAGTTPVALLLDDLQWADSTSLRLLLYLARHARASRTFILGIYRDVEVGRQHPLEGMLREVMREGLAERIHLQRLDSQGTSQLMAAIMGEQEVSDQFAGAIYSRTEGNAFFIQQVMRTLVERGDVVRQGGSWTRAEIESIEIPESIRSVVGQRLARLSRPAQEILSQACVLGQTFRFADLATLAAESEDEIEAALEEAEQAGLVKALDAETFTFDHALTQGALYAELSPRRKRKLHRAAGDAIERSAELTTRSRAAELAWHFLHGDDDERALHFALLAGDQAEAVFAHDEAESQYRTALELARELHSEREIEALEKLGSALLRGARLDEAQALLEETRRRCGSAGDRDREARAVAQLGKLHMYRGSLAQGVSLIRAFLTGLGDSVPSRGLSQAWLELASLLSNQTEPSAEQALAAADRASEIAESLSDRRLLAAAGMQRGLALSLAGRLVEAREELTRAVVVADDAGELEPLLRALNVLATIEIELGEIATARLHRERALDIAQRLGDPQWIVSSGIYLANVSFHVEGDWTRARKELNELLQALERMGGATELTASPLSFLGFLDLSQGNDEEGFRLLARAEALTEDPFVGGFTLVAKASYAVAHAQLDEAIRLLDAFVQSPDVVALWLVWGFALLAEAYLAIGDIERAEAAVQRAFAQADRLGGGSERIDALRAQGRIETKRGNWKAAIASFEMALKSIPSQPWSPHRAAVLHDYGVTEVERGNLTAARERFEEALVIWRRLGAWPSIEKTERALKTCHH